MTKTNNAPALTVRAEVPFCGFYESAASAFLEDCLESEVHYLVTGGAWPLDKEYALSYVSRRISAETYDALRPLLPAITVNTVDAFQGQERDVVLVSLVRANDAGQIGFLSDLRRMNVAMTRARSKLIIIGCAATLTRHRFYKALYEHCKKAPAATPAGEDDATATGH